jgi:hypothetical protein
MSNSHIEQERTKNNQVIFGFVARARNPLKVKQTISTLSQDDLALSSIGSDLTIFKINQRCKFKRNFSNEKRHWKTRM